MLIHTVHDTINFTWYTLIRNIPHWSYETRIDRGSFENQDTRHQFPAVAIEITKPSEDMIPIVPVSCQDIAPTDPNYVEDYFANYLMNHEVAENEQYTYGQRITDYLEEIINRINDSPFNNQMVIEVAKPEDISLNDPPCLRLIDFKVTPDYKLNLHVYFRSWDLWSGLPTNLAGLELLKQYVVEHTGVFNGSLFAYSSGLHIYGINMPNVNRLLGKEDNSVNNLQAF